MEHTPDEEPNSEQEEPYPLRWPLPDYVTSSDLGMTLEGMRAWVEANCPGATEYTGFDGQPCWSLVDLGLDGECGDE